jgi:hypothetical protein
MLQTAGAFAVLPHGMVGVAIWVLTASLVLAVVSRALALH